MFWRTTRSMPILFPKKPSVQLDSNSDGKIDEDEVLQGIFKKGEAKARAMASLTGTTVQHVPLTKKELNELNISVDEHGRRFSARFQAWRSVNMNIATVALFLRMVLTVSVVAFDAQQKIAESGAKDCA